jgi:hypothetical protein
MSRRRRYRILRVDVAAAGDGAITITTPGTPLITPPKLVSASCNAAKKQRGRAIQVNLK